MHLRSNYRVWEQVQARTRDYLTLKWPHTAHNAPEGKIYLLDIFLLLSLFNFLKILFPYHSSNFNFYSLPFKKKTVFFKKNPIYIYIFLLVFLIDFVLYFLYCIFESLISILDFWSLLFDILYQFQTFKNLIFTMRFHLGIGLLGWLLSPLLTFPFLFLDISISLVILLFCI